MTYILFRCCHIIGMMLDSFVVIMGLCLTVIFVRPCGPAESTLLACDGTKLA